jgi:flagellar motility protein MotE (MotC chaperone)
LGEGESLTIEQITLGAVLRIADSLERMERPFLETQELVVFWKKIAKEREQSLDILRRSRTALKGMNTKLRRQLDELKEEIEKLQTPTEE